MNHIDYDRKVYLCYEYIGFSDFRNLYGSGIQLKKYLCGPALPRKLSSHLIPYPSTHPPPSQESFLQSSIPFFFLFERAHEIICKCEPIFLLQDLPFPCPSRMPFCPKPCEPIQYLTIPVPPLLANTNASYTTAGGIRNP